MKVTDMTWFVSAPGCLFLLRLIYSHRDLVMRGEVFSCIYNKATRSRKNTDTVGGGGIEE